MNVTARLSLLLLIFGCLSPGQLQAKGADQQTARPILERGTQGACDAGLKELPPCFVDDCRGSSTRCFASGRWFPSDHRGARVDGRSRRAPDRNIDRVAC
jgi:hypothetical protein